MSKQTPLAGMFASLQPLHGRGWLATLTPEDRKVFSEVGRAYGAHGHLGGLERAKTAKRDERGRFIKKGE